MGNTANKQMICEVLMEAAKTDKNIVALCSDSRGSGSFTPFAQNYPEQFVEYRDRRTESGQYCRRSCKMREKSICGLSRVFSLHEKL